MKKTSYELRFGRPPKVSHFRVFGCKCFILKQGNLDKFESRSSDDIFLGYASHSHAYRVLNLKTNRVIETYEVTFDETMPCFVPIFECAGDQEISESIFVEENEEDADWGDAKPTSSATLVKSATTTLVHGPDPSSSTTWGPNEPPPQPRPAAPEEALAIVEGEATSLREAPWHIQRRHLPQTMIDDISQRVTRSRSYEISHFAHSAFVANFEPQNVRHTLSDPDWVNAMHEEL
jgi:hypothetical protein